MIVKANSERDRLMTLIALRDTIEELKVAVRVCKEVKAFNNFNTFKHLMEEVISLSRQSEGWLKSSSPVSPPPRGGAKGRGK